MDNEHSREVKEHFSQWKDYDDNIKKIVPFYDIQFQVVIEIINQLQYTKPDILDIGTGTGNLAERLLSAFPDSHVTGIDFVEEFVSIAKAKLRHFHPGITIKLMDIKDFDFSSKYHVVVSSYVFHHFTDQEKAGIYEKIYKSLHSKGLFIICDFVGSLSPFFFDMFDRLRMEQMRNNGIPEDEIQMQFTEHRKLEFPLPYEQQYDLLDKIGFSHIECFWKYLNLAIFGGIKD